MSDAYSAYLDRQEEEYARQKAEERKANKVKAEAKIKRCKADLKSSNLKYIKCCGTCNNYLRDEDSACYRLCVKHLSKFNVCKYWKLSKLYAVPVKDMKVDEMLVYDSFD